MRKLDYFWASNEDWYHLNEYNMCFEINEDAPKEAKESYERYKKRKREVSMEKAGKKFDVESADKQKISFGTTHSPYLKNGETMKEWFEAYENDTARNIEIDGIVYSKIIFWCDFYRNDEKMLLVSIEIGNDCKIGDILVDENGNEFVFKDVEKLKYSSEIPRWACSVSSILLQPINGSVGEYLCRKE